MRIRNLTPHRIRLYHEDRCVLDVEPEHHEEDSADSESVEVSGITIPIVSRELSAPEELPEYEDGTILVVSLPALMGLAAAGWRRDDIYAPDTGSGAMRDGQGQILGTTRLIRLGLPEVGKHGVYSCD